MLTVRHAAEADRAFWFSLDRHLPEAAFSRKIRDGEALVALEDGRPAGLLRWNLFWDEIPFCNLLFVVPDRRRRGIGAALMKAWEDEMRENGHGPVLVSTQSDEEAQHFYRKLGYRDCGGFSIRPHDPTELLFVKELNAESSEVSS